MTFTIYFDSRAALLTGLYPYKLGIQRGNVSPFRPYGLASRFKLLPEMLKERGYSTHLVGIKGNIEKTL